MEDLRQTTAFTALQSRPAIKMWITSSAPTRIPPRFISLQSLVLVITQPLVTTTSPISPAEQCLPLNWLFILSRRIPPLDQEVSLVLPAGRQRGLSLLVGTMSHLGKSLMSSPIWLTENLSLAQTSPTRARLAEENWFSPISTRMPRLPPIPML